MTPSIPLAPPRLLLCPLLLLVSGTLLAEVHGYHSLPMTPEQAGAEIQSDGYGAFSALYDDDSNLLIYHFSWRLGGTATATAAHLHGPAGVGENGGVRLNLGPLDALNEGVRAGSATLDAEQESELLAGQWYINVHSDAYPAGEIRVQLLANSPELARYEPADGTLILPTVAAPGLGVFEARMVLEGTERFRIERLERRNRE